MKDYRGIHRVQITTSIVSNTVMVLKGKARLPAMNSQLMALEYRATRYRAEYRAGVEELARPSFALSSILFVDITMGAGYASFICNYIYWNILFGFFIFPLI